MFKKRPETIENRWDILYSDYPEVYHEFAKVKRVFPSGRPLEKFDYTEKTILDLGSGSGMSTFVLAPKAKYVIGLEIEDEMRYIAQKEAMKKSIKNVSFIKGSATDIPFRDNYFDFVIASTLAVGLPEEIKQYVNESKRVLKQNGTILCLNIAPMWYGGHLAPVILGEKRVTELDVEGVINTILNESGFEYWDFDSVQEYGSIRKIVRTYGFIFGKKAIEHIKENKITNITWKSRLHYFTKN